MKSSKNSMPLFYVNKKHASHVVDLQYKNEQDFLNNRPHNSLYSNPRDLLDDDNIIDDFVGTTEAKAHPVYLKSEFVNKFKHDEKYVPKRAARHPWRSNEELMKEASATYYRIKTRFDPDYQSHKIDEINMKEEANKRLIDEAKQKAKN